MCHLSGSSCHPNWPWWKREETAAAGKVPLVLLQSDLVPPVQPLKCAAGSTVPVLGPPYWEMGSLCLYLAGFLLKSPLLIGVEVPSFVHPTLSVPGMDTWPPTYTVRTGSKYLEFENYISGSSFSLEFIRSPL